MNSLLNEHLVLCFGEKQNVNFVIVIFGFIKRLGIYDILLLSHHFWRRLAEKLPFLICVSSFLCLRRGNLPFKYEELALGKYFTHSDSLEDWARFREITFYFQQMRVRCDQQHVDYLFYLIYLKSCAISVSLS